MKQIKNKYLQTISHKFDWSWSNILEYLKSLIVISLLVLFVLFVIFSITNDESQVDGFFGMMLIPISFVFLKLSILLFVRAIHANSKGYVCDYDFSPGEFFVGAIISMFIFLLLLIIFVLI